MEKMPSNKGSKWRSRNPVGMKDFFRHYKESVENPVDSSTYGKVLRMCNQEFMRMIIEDGKCMRIPYLSTLEVRKAKSAQGGVDYKTLNELGKVVHLDNEHSDGYIGKFHWTKAKLPIVGKKAYSFQPTRDNARAVSAEFKKFNGHAKYTERINYGK